jgi:hypothetical protein
MGLARKVSEPSSLLLCVGNAARYNNSAAAARLGDSFCCRAETNTFDLLRLQDPQLERKRVRARCEKPCGCLRADVTQNPCVKKRVGEDFYSSLKLNVPMWHKGSYPSSYKPQNNAPSSDHLSTFAVQPKLQPLHENQTFVPMRPHRTMLDFPVTHLTVYSPRQTLLPE